MAMQTVTADEVYGLKEAFSDTESEIFDEGTGAEPLEKTGDHSLEEIEEGIDGAEADDESDEAADETEADAEGDEPEAGEAEPDLEGRKEPVEARERLEPRIPSGRLREETRRAQAAEAERDTVRAELKALNDRFEAFTRGQQQPRPQEQQPAKTEPEGIPDPFAEPEKHTAYIISQAVRQAETRVREQFIESNLADGLETHKGEFTAAYTELKKIGEAEKAQFGRSTTVGRIWASPNPTRELMKWHKQQTTLRDIGDDPQAYADKLLDDPEFLARAVERARESARTGNNGRARATTRLPPSLNSQTGGSHQVGDPDLYDGSETSVFASAFK
jgi:hypothetical protein